MSVSAPGKRTDSDSLAVGCVAAAEGHGVLTFPSEAPTAHGKRQRGEDAE